MLCMYRRQNIIMRIDIPQLLSVLRVFLSALMHMLQNYEPPNHHPEMLGSEQVPHPWILIL